MYKTVLHRNAAKFFEIAEKKDKTRIAKAIEEISKDPRTNIHIKKLQGELGHMYRYRLGDLRILFEIHDDVQTIRIKSIDSRGSVYK
jgi:mRNA interferase RelE/StbE